MIYPEGPDHAQQVRDRAGQPDAMDAQRATMVLRRMKDRTERLKHAVRWGSLKRWSEQELVAQEYKLQSEIDAIDFALDVLSLLETPIA